MPIDSEKRTRLEAAGFKIGTVTEFLELTPEESMLIEMKLALSRSLKQRRTAQHLSQTALAIKLNSSQSRIAKMEAGDPGVSIDLLLGALLATGATRADISRAICSDTDGALRTDAKAVSEHAHVEENTA